ncbi:MAG TPA: hypothetical protein VK029_05570 [Pseudogracilibacillus sp.]|nr:hypothetical protein [Pseudogracilibacillus sp.]
MESFIEFVLSNIFIVVIVVAGLINLLSGRKKEERKEERRRQLLEERRRRQREQQMAEQKHPEREDTPVYVPEHSFEQPMEQQVEDVEMTGDFEQQRQAQYERLREQIQASSMFVAEDEKMANRTLHSPSTVSNAHESVQVHLLNEPLSRKRLMESVIMAEVLGPPRAYKKHRPFYRQ